MYKMKAYKITDVNQRKELLTYWYNSVMDAFTGEELFGQFVEINPVKIRMVLDMLPMLQKYLFELLELEQKIPGDWYGMEEDNEINEIPPWRKETY